MSDFIQLTPVAENEKTSTDVSLEKTNGQQDNKHLSKTFYKHGANHNTTNRDTNQDCLIQNNIKIKNENSNLLDRESKTFEEPSHNSSSLSHHTESSISEVSLDSNEASQSTPHKPLFLETEDKPFKSNDTNSCCSNASNTYKESKSPKDSAPLPIPLDMVTENANKKDLLLDQAEVFSRDVQLDNLTSDNMLVPECPLSPKIRKASESTTNMYQKHIVFKELTEWEIERQLHSQEIEKILDPIVDELFINIQESKDSSNKLLKYFKDRIKIQREFVSKMRNCRCIRSLIDHEQGSFETDAHSLYPTEPHNISGESRHSSIDITSHDSIDILYKAVFYEAKYIESFTAYLEEEEVSGNFQRSIRDFEKATGVLLQRVNEARHRLKTHLHVVVSLWNDFHKLFGKEEEKEKQANISILRDVSQPTGGDMATGYSNSPNTAAVLALSGRQSKDPWLLERRYIHAAISSHQMCNAYYDVVRQTAIDIQYLENWRSEILKNFIMQYVSKFTETLRSIAGCLGHIHYIVDPDDFKSQALHATLPINKDKGQDPVSEEENTKISHTLHHDSNESPDRTTLNTSNSSDEVQQLDVSILHPQVRAKLEAARSFINNSNLPESRFAIKISHVRRAAGYFGKWSEGLLVLTWDRYLHMFRSHDDMQPLWSMHIPSSEIRITEEVPGSKTIEVRDKRSFLNVLSQRSFFFRSVSNSDHLSWLSCLELAENADDYTFRSEASRLATVQANQSA